MSVPPRDRLPYCHLFRLAMRQSTPYRCVPSGCAYLNCAPLQAARGKLGLTFLFLLFIFSSHAWTIYGGGIINSFSKGTLIPSHRLQIWHSTPRRRCYELIPLCGRQDAAYPRVTLHAWDIMRRKKRISKYLVSWTAPTIYYNCDRIAAFKMQPLTCAARLWSVMVM